jgi:SAM-dependent methyltransferase
MPAEPWNHNLHYHDLVLRAVPPTCRHALDVGCGRGLLARRLADRATQVTAIDREPLWPPDPTGRIAWIAGDAMTHPFPVDSFDLITAVAVLHHLPLRPALTRFRTLLRPGGVLAIVGLYRVTSLTDYAIGGMALPPSWLIRRYRGEAPVGAPIQDPVETLADIRSATLDLLPGAAFRRHFFFRYSLLWRKP